MPRPQLINPVSRETPLGRILLPDTEVAEDHVQEVLDVDLSRNGAERPQGEAQVFRRKLR
jgi:hypothetical protein